jgi:ribulose-5-phosphate 4-epimerase/fuculose-1-phosphate aldolase
MTWGWLPPKKQEKNAVKKQMLSAVLVTLSCFIHTVANAQTNIGPAPLSDADPALINDLVAANHILAEQGIVDGFGHVSVRHDKIKTHFLLSRSMAPALVTSKDIMEFDENCEPINSEGRQPYLERFIHCELYRGRPEIQSVIHNHSPAVIPFGVANVPLRSIYHMSAFLGDSTPVFEIRTAGGEETDMLIRSRSLGAAMAAAMGNHPVLLIRGHGSTVVGNSLPQAVFRAVYTEVNAKLEAEALRLGNVTFLNAKEAQNAAATNDGQVGRTWALWKMRVEPSK